MTRWCRGGLVCGEHEAYIRRMPASQDELRSILTGEHESLVAFRKQLRRMPTGPRCKLCAAPFAGPGGAILRHVGFGRYPGNPALCNNCISSFRKAGMIGAEIPVSLLFADVRGSTGIGERLNPTDFRAYLDRFYRIGSESILASDGLVDKLVGDEIIGLFFGGVSGPRHAAAAIDAATRLMVLAGRSDATSMGPIPIGAAVHTGDAYVGTTGPAGAVDDFTALGDTVNSASRLASAAAAGELLISVAAADLANYQAASGEPRTVDIRGREAAIDVVVVRP